jgi:hypothetical protein
MFAYLNTQASKASEHGLNQVTSMHETDVRPCIYYIPLIFSHNFHLLHNRQIRVHTKWHKAYFNRQSLN